MNNRDKLLDLLFNPEKKFLEKFQILFFTHDKNLYHFVADKIKQWDSIPHWVFKEIYIGKTDDKEKPEFIDSDLEYIDKAKKYFKAHDYPICALYIRKELEKTVVERLTDEFVKNTSSEYRNLNTLWGHLKERYRNLGNPLDDITKNNFEQTKLMVLNPQAHHNLSEPVYKVELEKAFELIDRLKSYPIPTATILLNTGMKLQFKHPAQNYSIDFELLSDFQIDNLEGNETTVFPKCKVLTWQFNGNEFWDVDNNRPVPQGTLETVLARTEDKLTKCLENLKKSPTLAITDQMFTEHTKLSNGIWTLKDIMDKAGITF